MKLIPGYEHDSHSSFWSLARLLFPEARAEALADPTNNPTRPSENHGAILAPDDQLACYDYLYFVCSVLVGTALAVSGGSGANSNPYLQPNDSYEKDYSPVWRDVMIHARWQPDLVELARAYLRRTFGLHESAELPPVRTTVSTSPFVGSSSSTSVVHYYPRAAWRLCELVRAECAQ